MNPSEIEDLVHKIAIELPVDEIKNFKKVNKRIRGYINNEFWRLKLLHDYPEFLIPKGISNYKSYYYKLHKSNYLINATFSINRISLSSNYNMITIDASKPQNNKLSGKYLQICLRQGVFLLDMVGHLHMLILRNEFVNESLENSVNFKYEIISDDLPDAFNLNPLIFSHIRISHKNSNIRFTKIIEDIEMNEHRMSISVLDTVGNLLYITDMNHMSEFGGLTIVEKYSNNLRQFKYSYLKHSSPITDFIASDDYYDGGRVHGVFISGNGIYIIMGKINYDVKTNYKVILMCELPQGMNHNEVNLVPHIPGIYYRKNLFILEENNKQMYLKSFQFDKNIIDVCPYGYIVLNVDIGDGYIHTISEMESGNNIQTTVPRDDNYFIHDIGMFKSENGYVIIGRDRKIKLYIGDKRIIFLYGGAISDSRYMINILK